MKGNDRCEHGAVPIFFFLGERWLSWAKIRSVLGKDPVDSLQQALGKTRARCLVQWSGEGAQNDR